MADGTNVFQSLAYFWLSLLEKAKQSKRKQFQNDADEAFRFFNGPHDFMYQDQMQSNPDPSQPKQFWMTTNKVAEFVQIFGPVLYHRNPNCQVNSRQAILMPPAVYGDPQNAMLAQQTSDLIHGMDQAKSAVMTGYLNWIPTETNLALHARRAVDEAIIKGRGLLWPQLYQPPGTKFLTVGAYFDTVDNLQIDPDCENLEDATWVAQECVHPVWQVEREYGLKPYSLPGNVMSMEQDVYRSQDNEGTGRQRSAVTNDLIRYWKIYSRMGLGARLQGGPRWSRKVLDVFGDHVFIVVASGVPYPLNVPPSLYAQPVAPGPQAVEMAKQLIRRTSWPTPFWKDNKWPFAVLDFHPVPRSPWPMSHLKPGMGELKFLNWAYSFLAGKIRTTCRDFVAVLKAAGSELKTSILDGRDLTLLEIEAQYKTISEVVQFLQHPQMNGDIFKVLQIVEQNFEKRVGLNELMYGQTESSFRSAAEADIKSRNLNVRPDDMAERVEAFMTQVFQMLAGASRYHLTGQDVSARLGPDGGRFWDAFLHTRNYADAARELEYKIEANSTKKPNRERDADNLQQAMSVLFQPLLDFGANTGQLGPVNALILEFCRVRDIPDPDRFVLRLPQPLGPPGLPPGGPGAPPGAPPGTGGQNGRPQVNGAPGGPQRALPAPNGPPR